MKKIFTLVCAMVTAFCANAVEKAQIAAMAQNAQVATIATTAAVGQLQKSATVALPAFQGEQLANVKQLDPTAVVSRHAKKSTLKAPARVAADFVPANQYIGSGLQSIQSQWYKLNPFAVTSGVDQEGYPYLANALPYSGRTLPYYYEVIDEKTIVLDQFIDLYDQTRAVYALDYTDYSQKGTGSVVFTANEAGVLSTPESHVVGLFVGTFDSQTGACTEIVGALAQFGNIVLTPFHTSKSVTAVSYEANYQEAQAATVATLLDAKGNAYQMAINAASLELGKTYTQADMKAVAYNGVATNDTAAFTLTQVNELDHVEAYMVINKDTFNLSFQAKPAKQDTIIVPSEKITLNNKLIAGFYTIGGTVTDGDNKKGIDLYIMNKSISGVYTEADLYAEMSSISYKEGDNAWQYYSILTANFKVSVKKDTVYLTGDFVAENDNTKEKAGFYVSMKYNLAQTWGEWADYAPFGVNTGTWEFTALSTYTQKRVAVQTRKDNTGLKQYKLAKWGEGMFANPGDGKVNLVIEVNGQKACTITPTLTDNMTSYAITDYYTFTGKNDNVSTFDAEKGAFTLNTVYFNPSTFAAKAVGVETFVMDTFVTKRDTIDIISTALKYNDSYLEDKKFVIYYASDVKGYDVFRVASANAITIDGTFKWSDGGINNPNSFFQVGTTKTYFQDGEFTVVTNNKDITLTGWMIGTDEKYYRLNMSYTSPEPKKTVEIVCSNMQVEDLTEDYGFFAYAGGDKDYTVYLYAVTDTAYGTFKLASGIIFVNNGTQTPDTVRAIEGEITISAEGKVATLTGSMLGNDTILYTFNWTGKVGILPFDSDEDFEGEFNLENADIKTSEGMIMLSAKNEDNQVVSLVFFAALTEDATIPADTYAINNSQEAGTVLASSGLTPVGQQMILLPSYAALSSELGITNAWFMVSGTVVVAEDGSITINALNSYDRNITITIDNPATALYRINANAAIRKAMIKGHVVIFKNNKAYNLMGAEL